MLLMFMDDFWLLRGILYYTWLIIKNAYAIKIIYE